MLDTTFPLISKKNEDLLPNAYDVSPFTQD